MTTKKILITGSSGFVGSYLLSKLSEGDHAIVCLDKVIRDNSLLNVKGNITSIQSDLSSLDESVGIKEALEGVTHVFHLASMIPSSKTKETSFKAEEFYKHNLLGTVHLISVLPKDVRWFCYASTVDVYGIPNTLPITEETPLNPLNDYARSKLAAEEVIKGACHERDISVAILRLSQVYGPGDRGPKLIPTVIQKIFNKESPTIFGKGEEQRDYLYVEDAVEAFWAAMSGEREGTFNVATGQSYPIGDVVKMIVDRMDFDGPIKYSSRKKDLFHLRFDVQRIKDQLKLDTVSLEEGLKQTIENQKVLN